ncbi:MAG: GGDEF domain-containing protein [Oligoflexia bacterium]|nr:GGDEF domain-containing protein [Oligoflexia bacterium]
MGDDSTVVLTDIKAALQSTEEEAKSKSACLLAIGGELNGTIFDLKPGVITFGRSVENTFALEFQGISRRHLQVTTQAISENSVAVTIEDLGSRNGTFLNNTKISGPVQLRKGDVVKLGAVAFKYLPQGDPERLTYDKIKKEAVTDGLTKCYNKAYFNQTCDSLVKKSKVTGTPLTLILFDLDHFKKLNDNYGHDAGDFVLKEISDLVRNAGIRECDIFARYGGEEFCILLPNTNLKNGFQIAERVRATIAAHDFIYSDKKLPVTASLGVADYRQGVNTGVDLFKRVDMALYKSKNGGRNQVNFYKDEPGTSSAPNASDGTDGTNQSSAK